LGCFNTKKRRPEALAYLISISNYIRKENQQEGFSKIIINPKEEVVLKSGIPVRFDIVNHVNNVKYLEWCLDHVDEKSILNEKLNSFEMNFMKELSLNDTVVIMKTSLKNPLHLVLQKKIKPVLLYS
jgi:acyl-ACP thioesterase